MAANSRIDKEAKLIQLPLDGSDPSPLTAWWPNEGMVAQNWGDKFNPVLITALSGRPVIHVQNIDPSQNLTNMPVYYVIGSSLSWARSDAVVWGSGFIQTNNSLACSAKNVVAVRGPLSRKKVAEVGGNPSMPMGDPALLLPLIYLPKIEPTVDVGIIQHFREMGTEALPEVPKHFSTRTIDITGEIKATIDAVLSCEIIISSSLHGLVIAHAYGRKGIWIKASNRPMGDDFKFRDYWASIGHPDFEAFDVRTQPLVPVEDLISAPQGGEIDLFALIEACPFVSSERKGLLLSMASQILDSNTIFSSKFGLRNGL